MAFCYHNPYTFCFPNRPVLISSYTFESLIATILLSPFPYRSVVSGMMLKLKLQYCGHLMRRVDSLEKTDAGRDWGQEEKGTTEDEMARWHRWLDGRESEWTPGVGDGQGGLACCDSLGHKESDTTEQLNWTEYHRTSKIVYSALKISYLGIVKIFQNSLCFSNVLMLEFWCTSVTKIWKVCIIPFHNFMICN